MASNIFGITKAAFLCASLTALTLNAFAGDVPVSPSKYRELAKPMAMPALGPGEYGTDTDNEDNAGTHNPDGDMDVYLFNTDAISPIEFNIALPKSVAGKPATLRMDVWDVDAASGEVDKVYVNGTQVGVLNGVDSEWGINMFAIPAGVLVAGNNLVKVDIDTANPGSGMWAVTIDYGIIKVSTTKDITRAWVAPVRQYPGQYVNFFAEMNAVVTEVKAYINGEEIILSDPDGDKVWSAQWQVPAGLQSKQMAFTMKAFNNGNVVSVWPRLYVKSLAQ